MGRKVEFALGLIAIFLLSTVTFRHFSNKTPSLLQDTFDGSPVVGLEQYRSTLSDGTILEEKKKAYEQGFIAGENQAEKNVMEDEDGSLQDSQLRRQQASVIKQISQLQLQPRESRDMMQISSRQQRLSQLERKLSAESKLLAKAQLLKEEEAANLKRTAGIENEYAKVLHSKLETVEEHGRVPDYDAKTVLDNGEAASLFSFCLDSFPEEVELQRYCYDRLLSSSDANTDNLEQPVPLESNNPNGYVLEPVISGVIPPDAVGLVEIPDDVVPSEAQFVNDVNIPPPDGIAEKSDPHSTSRLVEVDGSSLSKTIRAAHRMGLQGIPEDIIYHPVTGNPRVYTLEQSSQRP